MDQYSCSKSNELQIALKLGIHSYSEMFAMANFEFQVQSQIIALHHMFPFGVNNPGAFTPFIAGLWRPINDLQQNTQHTLIEISSESSDDIIQQQDPSVLTNNIASEEPILIRNEINLGLTTEYDFNDMNESYSI